MKRIYKNRQGASIIVVSFSLVTLMALASLAIDLSMVMNAQQELQNATNTAALVGATMLEPQNNGGQTVIDTSNISTKVQKIFDYSLNSMVTHTKNDYINININASSKAINITATGITRTYFLAVLGISYIELTSQATAISAPYYLSETTASGKSSVMQTTKYETNIRMPVGDASNLSGSTTSNDIKYENIYGLPDNKAISLGGGGYIMIKLPFTIKDQAGADLFIKELGNSEGYFVFAGADNNPDNPYVNESSQGAGISWQNISCTGTPVDTDSTTKRSFTTTVKYLDGDSTTEAKFYGSGYFDLGATCNGYDYKAYLKNAKYLKIVDDNTEDGFMATLPDTPVKIIGEHSSATPGADIDAIAALHESRLIQTKDYHTKQTSGTYKSTDDDSDGLINIIETIIGTDPNEADTDGDGINDNLEYSGWFYDSTTPTSIIDADPAPTEVYFTSPITADEIKDDEYILNKIKL